MAEGELRRAKRKLREMQGARDRERGRKVCVFVCVVCACLCERVTQCRGGSYAKQKDQQR